MSISKRMHTRKCNTDDPGRMLLWAGMAIACGMLSGCGGSGGGGNSTPSPPVTQTPPDPAFSDVTAASGIDYKTGYVGFDLIDPEIAPSAAAAGDYDDDGDIDLFIVRGDIGPNLLYRNDGDLVFVDVAMDAGIAYTAGREENYRHSAPAFADMDGDGDLDLFVGGTDDDPSMIFMNNGDGTFYDVTFGSGLDFATSSFSLSASFGDYDLDGDVDLAISHWGTPRDYENPGDTEHLWRNDSDESDIVFTPVSIEAGLSPSIIAHDDPNVVEGIGLDAQDWTFTPTFARIDGDLYPELLMVADFNHTQLFMNNRDGTFTNVTDPEVLIDGNGMGSAVGDYDNDGDLDWFVSSILDRGDMEDPTKSRIGNRLYRNTQGVFEDVSNQAGITDGGWGWGSCFLDFENDGDLDIYHTNGWDEPDFQRDLSRAFVNLGDGTFEEQGIALGLEDREQGRGVICADFDNDGDVDIFLLHEKCTLWRNNSEDNNYLGIRLIGVPPNTQALGTRIILQAGDVMQIREVTGGNNYVSQNPTWQTFGLGQATSADLTIEWPDGNETVVHDVGHSQIVTYQHPDAE